jgi:hypothetical protein
MQGIRLQLENCNENDTTYTNPCRHALRMVFLRAEFMLCSVTLSVVALLTSFKAACRHVL